MCKIDLITYIRARYTKSVGPVHATRVTTVKHQVPNNHVRGGKVVVPRSPVGVFAESRLITVADSLADALGVLVVRAGQRTRLTRASLHTV